MAHAPFSSILRPILNFSLDETLIPSAVNITFLVFVINIPRTRCAMTLNPGSMRVSHFDFAKKEDGR